MPARGARSTPLSEGLLEMSRKGLGMTVVVDADDRILGVFTDGDLRRTLDRQIDVHTTPMSERHDARMRKTHRPARARRRGGAPDGSTSITALPVADEQGAWSAP